jgi:hypothetical protein
LSGLKTVKGGSQPLQCSRLRRKASIPALQPGKFGLFVYVVIVRNANVGVLWASDPVANPIAKPAWRLAFSFHA